MENIKQASVQNVSGVKPAAIAAQHLHAPGPKPQQPAAQDTVCRQIRIQPEGHRRIVMNRFLNFSTPAKLPQTQASQDARRLIEASLDPLVTDYPLTIRHQDGRLTDVLYNASVYKDAAGKVLGVFAAGRA